MQTENAEKIYNLGIIGFGGMASYHFSCLSKNPATRVKPYGVFDLNEERMKVAREKGMKTYSSKDELLADKNIDIVLIATSNEVHKSLAIDALNAGKHCICEKPVTISSDELVEIMEVAKKTGKVFTVDQNRRTNHDFVMMMNAVKNDEIGKPYVIESRVEGSRGMPTGWRTLKSLGGGMMLDWGVHLIDQIMFMYDNKVTSVFCKMFSIEYPEVDDNFRLDFQLENGPLVHIEVSTNNYITHPRWYVLGERGTLQVDDWDCNGRIVRCLDKQSEWQEEIVYTKAGPTKTMAPRRADTIETVELSEPTITDDLTVVYDGFVRAIEGGELYVKPEQALRVLKVMEAAFESDKTNTVIKTDI